MEEKEKKENFFNGFDDDILTDEDFEEEGAEGDKGEGKTDNPADKTDGTEGKTAEDKTDEGSVKTDEGKSDEDKKADEAKKKAEEAEKNAKFAEMRRKQEAEAKAKKEREAELERAKREAATKAELGVLKENPYTGEKIEDESDLEIYKIQKSLEDEGKDPVKDLPKKLAQIQREKAAEAKKVADSRAEVEAKAKEKATKEVNELRTAYPDLNTAELAKDPLWLEVSGDKLDRLTLKEIYEFYYLPKKNQSKQTKTDDTKVDEENGKKVTKVPSSNSNGGKTSPKNYLEMTDEEYLKAEKADNEDFFN